jgi:hypothetical protein
LEDRCCVGFLPTNWTALLASERISKRVLDAPQHASDWQTSDVVLICGFCAWYRVDEVLWALNLKMLPSLFEVHYPYFHRNNSFTLFRVVLLYSRHAAVTYVGSVLRNDQIFCIKNTTIYLESEFHKVQFESGK